MRDKEEGATIKAKQLLAKPPGGAMHQSRKCFRARSVHSDKSSHSHHSEMRKVGRAGACFSLCPWYVSSRGAERKAPTGSPLANGCMNDTPKSSMDLGGYFPVIRVGSRGKMT